MAITEGEAKDAMATEIFIMRTCKHENIVEYIDSFIVVYVELWVVMELMPNGKLNHVIFQYVNFVLIWFLGALADILNQFDNGVIMQEDTIAYVCREVITTIIFPLKFNLFLFCRP